MKMMKQVNFFRAMGVAVAWLLLAGGLKAGGHDPAGLGRGNQGLVFLENRGQVLDENGRARPDILFMAKAGGVKVFVDAQGLSYQFEKGVELAVDSSRIPKGMPDYLQPPVPMKIEVCRVGMRLVGSNPAPAVRMEEATPYYENFYNVLSAPDGILEVASYRRIVLEDVYPGIDWVLYSDGGGMKYDFVVHPGGDPSMIVLQYDGPVEVSGQADGGLRMKTALGEIREAAPVSYHSGGVAVASSFRVTGNLVRFDVGSYPADAVLTIDPSLAWGTYFGGIDTEYDPNVGVGYSGEVYLTGYTRSATNIAISGFQMTQGSVEDAFLAKFDSTGQIIWSTYYGGESWEKAIGVVVDRAGCVYMCGNTSSFFGVAYNGYQNFYTPGLWVPTDAFLVKFNAAGARMWGTYFGGDNQDGFGSMVIDSAGDLYVTGAAASAFGVAVNGHQNTHGGDFDGVVAKFDTSGGLLWSTYYGGSESDGIGDITLDDSNNVYIVGTSQSDTGIAWNGFRDTLDGYNDLYIAKFNSAGVRQWGTYYGGSVSEYQSGGGIVYSQGCIYAIGCTQSANGIAHAGFQNSLSGPGDAFLVKFDRNGNRIWGTYYGGSNWDFFQALAVDAHGNLYAVGRTMSITSIASNGYQNSHGGSFYDGIMVKFDSSGGRIWGSYFGGERDEYVSGVCVRGTEIYITGYTYSRTFISTPPAYQDTLCGEKDVYLAKFHDACTNGPVAQCHNATVQLVGGAMALPAGVVDNGSSSYCGHTITVAVQPDTVDCGSLGPVPVVLTVYDHGNATTSTCNAVLTVVDGEAPVIQCPPSQTVGPDPGVCSATVSYALPAATDNCLGVSVVQTGGLGSGAAFPMGVTTQTFQAVDAAGNTSVCSWDIMVELRSTQVLDECHGFSVAVGSHVYTTSGIYVDTLVSVGGCDSVVTTDLEIGVMIDTSVSVSSTQLVSNSFGVDYQWLDCNQGLQPISGAVQQGYAPGSAGAFAVAVTVGGCTDTSGCITFLPVGVQSAGLAEGFRISPNPARDLVAVEWTAWLPDVRIVVSDLAGRVLFMERAVDAQGMLLDVSGLAAGMYHVSVDHGGKRAMLRLVKE
jgi:hypothetical protein